MTDEFLTEVADVFMTAADDYARRAYLATAGVIGSIPWATDEARASIGLELLKAVVFPRDLLLLCLIDAPSHMWQEYIARFFEWWANVQINIRLLELGHPVSEPTAPRLGNGPIGSAGRLGMVTASTIKDENDAEVTVARAIYGIDTVFPGVIQTSSTGRFDMEEGTATSRLGLYTISQIDGIHSHPIIQMGHFYLFNCRYIFGIQVEFSPAHVSGLSSRFANASSYQKMVMFIVAAMYHTIKKIREAYAKSLVVGAVNRSVSSVPSHVVTAIPLIHGLGAVLRKGSALHGETLIYRELTAILSGSFRPPDHELTLHEYLVQKCI